MSNDGVFPKITPAGVSQLGCAPNPGEASLPRERLLLGAASLTELSDQLAFYTLGLVFANVPLPFDPFTAFCQEQNLDWRQAVLKFDRPVFRGLDIGDDVSWNFVLTALPKDRWARFLQHMGTVAFTDHRTLWRVRYQTLKILDPTLNVISSLTPEKQLEVTAFCLDSSSGVGYFQHDPAKWWIPPSAVWDPNRRFPDTVRFHRALEQEHDRPYDAIDPPD